MTWVAVAIGGSALIGGGVAMYEGSQNRAAQVEAENKFNAQPDYKQLPGYAEADSARGDWWNTLQDWKSSGTWGVNAPDYDKAYESAAKRINQYYWGGPTGNGLIDKIRAGAARRNVQDSPATDVLTQRAGAEQAFQLGDLSSKLDVTKAGAIETARSNWLNSLTNLANLKPSYVSGKSGQFSAPSVGGLGTAITTAGGGVAQALQNRQNQDWYSSLLNQYSKDQSTPATTQSSLKIAGSQGNQGNAWNNPEDFLK